MEELLQAQLDAQRAGEAYAVVTIAEASGSVPRKNGKMLVFFDGRTLGTVGGGPAEQMAKRDALAAIDAGENRFLHYNFPSPDGASCSSRLSLLVEVFQPKPLLVVFGGGHVGTSLLRLAKPTGFRALLFDDRTEEQIPEAVSLADRFVRVENVERDILNTSIPTGAFFVLCGHDHAVDGEALAAALQKSPRYIGMLASRRKILSLFAMLKERGVTQKELDFVHDERQNPGRDASSRSIRWRSGWTSAEKRRRSWRSGFWRRFCSSKTGRTAASGCNQNTRTRRRSTSPAGCFYNSLRMSAISSGV